MCLHNYAIGQSGQGIYASTGREKRGQGMCEYRVQFECVCPQTQAMRQLQYVAQHWRPLYPQLDHSGSSYSPGHEGLGPLLHAAGYMPRSERTEGRRAVQRAVGGERDLRHYSIWTTSSG